MNNPDCIVVLGTGGLAQYIKKECQKSGIECFLVSRSMFNFNPEFDEVDEFCQMWKRLNKHNSVVINTIGNGNVARLESHPIDSYRDNAKTIEGAVRWAAGNHLIHVSTNDVFGQDIPQMQMWDASCDPKPVGIYATHKHVAEQVLKTLYFNHSCIVRATFMSPFSKSKGGETFYYRSYKAFKEDGVVNGYVDQFTCPLSVDTYASVLVECAINRCLGTVHFATKPTSRFRVLGLIAGIVGSGQVNATNRPTGALFHPCLWPTVYDIKEECHKFVKVCEEYEKDVDNG